MKRLKKWYDRLKKPQKERIIFFLNYFINSFPITILVYIVMSLWFGHSLLRCVSTYLSVLVFLIYFEYYYVWLRSKWKE